MFCYQLDKKPRQIYTRKVLNKTFPCETNTNQSFIWGQWNGILHTQLFWQYLCRLWIYDSKSIKEILYG